MPKPDDNPQSDLTQDYDMSDDIKKGYVDEMN